MLPLDNNTSKQNLDGCCMQYYFIFSLNVTLVPQYAGQSLTFVSVESLECIRNYWFLSFHVHLIKKTGRLDIS